jgi:hypothetical protein
MMFREVLHMVQGQWAVAVRIASTGKGMFVDGANEVTEEVARKAFGRAIRAGELGLPVDGEMISAVRLLKKDHEIVLLDKGDAIVDAEGSWRIAQQHDVGAIERWKNHFPNDPKGMPPYLDETIALGVPCIPGAWGGDGCAMHSGFPRDANGLCVEGHRAVKRLGLIVVPKVMQERSGFPSTMTREEVDLVMAETVSEIVHREKGEELTDEQLNEALAILEARKAQHERKVFVEFPNASK